VVIHRLGFFCNKISRRKKNEKVPQSFRAGPAGQWATEEDAELSIVAELNTD